MEICVTPTAVEKIKALQLQGPLGRGAGGSAPGNDPGPDTCGLRIELHAGGCCGTCYRFAVGLAAPGDTVLQVGPARIILPPDSLAILYGARLDYGAQLKPPRFRILRNQNTPVRCPCGRSFGHPFPGKCTPWCEAYRPMPWDEPPTA